MIKRTKLNQDVDLQQNMENAIFDSVAIEKRRVKPEDANLLLGKPGEFKCNYCSKKFVSETIFMRHFCEARRRAEEMVKPIGQSAFMLYNDWMKIRKFGAQSAPAFMSSKFYKAFINFAELIKKTNLPSPVQYIKVMVDNDMPPNMWCRDTSYAMYLNWIDAASDPVDQVSESIQYLIKICEEESVQLTDIFEHLGTQRILQLIRQRRLTPWFLFASKRFTSVLKSLSPEERSVFSGVINASVWSEKFQKSHTKVKEINLIVQGLNL